MNNIEVAVELALDAAFQAGEAVNRQLGDENTRGLDCGFAWVVVRPANCKLAKAMKAHGASKHYNGGVCLWNPARTNTQSISPKEYGARAFVASIENSLKGEGYKSIVWGSRYD